MQQAEVASVLNNAKEVKDAPGGGDFMHVEAARHIAGVALHYNRRDSREGVALVDVFHTVVPVEV
jgi:hypothetical protein